MRSLKNVASREMGLLPGNRRSNLSIMKYSREPFRWFDEEERKVVMKKIPLIIYLCFFEDEGICASGK